MNNRKQFLKQLHSMSHSRSPHRTFSDWLEIAAISLHQLPYHSGELAKDDDFERLEVLYLERIKSYSQDELKILAELIGLTMAEHHTGYGDFLGEIAGEAELLNKGSGQFFTPYHLCRAISKMTLGNVRQMVEAKGILTVCEPAVGAGALVIASAEEVASQGVDPCAHLQFDCTDVSRDAFNMAYIQLSALGLQAVVRHGNTLSGETGSTARRRSSGCLKWLAPQRQAARLAQVMRSLPADEATAKAVTPATTLFDLEQFAGAPLTKQRSRRPPDVVLERQMNLFS